MKKSLESLAPSRSIRALVLAALTTAGCTTYNNYYYNGEAPDSGVVDGDSARADGSRDAVTDGGLVDAGSDRADTSADTFVDSGADIIDAGGDTASDAGRDVTDTGTDSARDSGTDGSDASVPGCTGFGFPGERFPVSVGSTVTVNITPTPGVTVRSFGIEDVVAPGVTSTSMVTPFETGAVTAAGMRPVRAFVIRADGLRSYCSSYPFFSAR